MDKKVALNPYNIVGTKGFKKCTPWRQSVAPATFTDREGKSSIKKFSSAQELDDNFFVRPGGLSCIGTVQGAMDILLAPPSTGKDVKTDHLVFSALVKTQNPSLSEIVANLITSKDKLFFVAHCGQNGSFRRLQLVSISLEASIKLHPSCFANRRFLYNFFIRHINDKEANLLDQRF